MEWVFDECRGDNDDMHATCPREAWMRQIPLGNCTCHCHHNLDHLFSKEISDVEAIR